MNRRSFLHGVSASLATPFLPNSSQRDSLQSAVATANVFIEKAEALKPRLFHTTVLPTSQVRLIADPAKFLGWQAAAIAPSAQVGDRRLRHGDSVILDFGRHLTGYLSFSIAGEGRGIDAPSRLRLTFGEVPAEIAGPIDPYNGTLSRAWFQDETINIDVIPARIDLPRRYAFRYLRIDVIATSPNYAVRLSDFSADAVSSAGGISVDLPAGTPELIRRIDQVSIATLRDCMQTVFEDGPKRDRRLWVGDMRLQALSNYATFRNMDLVKRCLYLLASFSRADGLIPACVFEAPQPRIGNDFIIDYAALYAAAVVDYAQATEDWATAIEVWPVVRRQMEVLSGYIGNDHIFAAPAGSWIFIDWSKQLDRTAAMHGVLIYCLSYARELARRANARQDAAAYGDLIQSLRSAARSAFWDPERGVFVSGPQGQVSLASQAWMTLAGVASSEEAASALRHASAMPDAVQPGGPYLYHYVLDAMIQCGMKKEALSLMSAYWGGMVEAGADTFWEVYDPSNPKLSPYGDFRMNSYCHAWSCTPAYLLRKRNLL